jgi:tetratricopeptide (TPR) repeat protein
MKVKFIIMALILSTNTSFAKKETTKDVMQEAFYSLTQLLPHMMSEMSFSDLKHEKKINSHLTRMVTAFKKGTHQNILKSPGLKPNYKSIVLNLDSALTSFSNGEKNFARLRLNDSMSLCVSCHTQFPQDKIFTPLVNSKSLKDKLKSNHYQLGNLYLILRDYEKSISEYSKYIEQFITENKSPDFINSHYNKFLINSFYKIVYITGKSLNSPNRTLAILTKLEKKYSLPSYVKAEIQIWKSRAVFWVNEFKRNKKNNLELMVKHLEKNIKLENNTVLSGDYDYDLMIVSGIFSKQLLANKKVKQGQVLYWMGIAEYRLGKSIFFNVGDSYLKQCIRENLKQKIATKCFKALESETNFKYTGTSGTNIPKEVQQELMTLKLLL